MCFISFLPNSFCHQLQSKSRNEELYPIVLGDQRQEPCPAFHCKHIKLSELIVLL